MTKAAETEEKKDVKIISDYTLFTKYPATHEELSVIKKTIAAEANLNDAEFFMFMDVCANAQLNPLLKQIYIWRHDGKLIIMISADGRHSNAEKHEDFIGIRASEICDGDDFNIDIVTGDVHHKINTLKERGAVLGAWAKVLLKDKPPVVTVIKKSEYETSSKDFSAWKKNPSDMCIKSAKAKAFKLAYIVEGVQSAEEWTSKDGKNANPIDHTESFEEAQISNYNDKLDLLFQTWEEFEGKDKAYYKQQILMQKEKGLLTTEEIDKWMEALKPEMV